MERAGSRGWGRCPPSGSDFAPHPVLQDYYFYLASNSQSPGNVYIDMASYEKIYDLKADYELPERIFLDKGTSYVFSVFLSVGGQSLEFTPERGLWRRPEWSSRGGVCEPGGRGEALTPPGACSAHLRRAEEHSGSGRGAGRPGLH